MQRQWLGGMPEGYLLLVVVHVDVGGVHGRHELVGVIERHGVNSYWLKLRSAKMKS